MTLTKQTALEYMAHGPGGPLVGIDNARVLDEAGRWLFDERAWNWTVGGSTTLDLTNAQSYITLPTDYARTKSIGFSNGLLFGVRETSVEELSRYRNVFAFPSYLLYVAVVWVADANGVPIPRWEVYPTPSATTLGALTLFYHKKWVDLASSDQVYIPVPDWFESLYVQAVRAIAWGYQMDNMDEQKMHVRQGRDFAAAVKRDESFQWKFGPMSGGSLDMASAPGETNWILSNYALPPAAI